MVVAAATAHGICHWCVDRTLRRQPWYAELSPAKRLDVDVNITWLLLGTALPVLYVMSLPELGASAVMRWRGTDEKTTLALILHIGQSVRDSLCLSDLQPDPFDHYSLFCDYEFRCMNS